MVGLIDARERARQRVPFEAKLHPPRLRPGIVRRPDLDDRLAAEADAVVVLVVAPAGYGKTTLMAGWSERDPRPVAWISITEADNDPKVLLAHLALALDSVDPLPEDVFAGLAISQAGLTDVQLPLLGQTVARCPRPFLLLLDDVHLARSVEALGALGTVSEHLPAGSQLVLAGREEPQLPVSRLRASGRLLKLDAESLAMTADEGTALLRAAGATVELAAARRLVEGTEGWPAGLYLAALALRDHPLPGDATERFSGADRFVADYLHDEVLRALPDEVTRFLIETSILARMSGPVCDAILERSGSGGLLEDLSRSNLFVVPLDRTADWYRYHHLFGDMLRAELRRRDPDRERDLHVRASAWFEANGDVESAIDHAHAADDPTRAAALIWSAAPIYFGDGRTATVARWLDRFTTDERTATAELAVTSAWCAMTAGDTQAVDQWAATAERLPPAAVLSDGTPITAHIALLSALVGQHGLSRIRDDAGLALDLDRDDSPYRTVAFELDGVARRLLGDSEGARHSFTEGARLGELFMPTTASQCLSQLSLLEAEADRWGEAERLTAHALRLVETYHLADRPGQAPVFAVASLVHAHAGSTTAARRAAKQAGALIATLVGVAPWAAIESSILVARASLLFGDAATAREHLADARRLLDAYPDSGTLPSRLAEVELQAAAMDRPLGLTVAPLTDAELRVLRYLPTHLSFAEIASELFVSRNTVKTQAIAVYRKLEVSSRSQAVERARALGLLAT